MKYRILVFLLFAIFQMQSQIVKNITFKGNKKTKSETLQKLIILKVGDALDSVTIADDAVLLSRLPAFNKVDFKVDKDLQGDFNIVFKVEETNTIIPEVNFWTAANQQFTYQLGVKEFNFLGENKQIGGFYRNNGFHSFSLNYKDPLLFGNQTGASLTLQSLTSLEPLYFDNGNSADYEFTNTSIEALVFKKLTVAHKLELGTIIFKEKYKYNSGFTSNEIPRELEQDKLLFKLNFSYNRLLYEYQYVDGFRSAIGVQYVTPIEAGQDEFSIAFNDFYYYKKVKKRGNLATRLHLGIATNASTPFAPFAVDNNLNIRGVGNIIDRGTAVAVLNLEYRYTLIDKKWFALQTNTFVDAGSWRTAGGDLKEIFEGKEARLHPGLGLRFIHKKIYNAVFRIDYGRSILNDKNEKGFVFGIGQYF